MAGSDMIVRLLVASGSSASLEIAPTAISSQTLPDQRRKAAIKGDEGDSREAQCGIFMAGLEEL